MWDTEKVLLKSSERSFCMLSQKEIFKVSLAMKTKIALVFWCPGYLFLYMLNAPLKLFVLKILFHLEETGNMRRIATSWSSIIAVNEAANYYFTFLELTAGK